VENATSRDIVVIRGVSSSRDEKASSITVGPARLNQLPEDFRADLAFIVSSEYVVPSQKDVLS
jgi:hypothetical protein